jgi:S1-C subfamily serine protease
MIWGSLLASVAQFSHSMGLSAFRPRRLGYGLLAFLCVIGLGFPPMAYAEPVTVAAANSSRTASLLQTSGAHNFIAEAVQKVGNTIVRIDTEKTVIHRSTDPFLSDPFFRDFFGEGYTPMPREDRLRGQGSGFIIDANGIILTNAHVVNDADTVSVTLKDGRVFEGAVQGVDEVSDLAVVKLKGVDGKLPVIPLGNSDEVQVGDWAIAVGNPVGLDNTVTLGIVSTLHRSSAEVGMANKRLDFIQTDAAINPGNSGGPLLDAKGNVIGINTAIRADAMGIGFAIPINRAKVLQDRLVRGERILHPYIGVQMTTLTPKLAIENNQDPNSPMSLPEINGVLVIKVLPNTPAANKGMRLGDVITAVDGRSIATANELQALVENAQVGQTLQLTVKRGDRTQTVAVKTAELKSAA